MKIPDGCVLIKKGGRPNKLDRDIGVLLMRYLLKDIRGGKASDVDPQVVKFFVLTDEAAMRTIIRNVEGKFGFVRKARKRINFEWQVLQVCEDAVMLARVVSVPQQAIVEASRQALKKVWLWSEGFTSALQLSSSKGMQPTDVKKWQLFKR